MVIEKRYFLFWAMSCETRQLVQMAISGKVMDQEKWINLIPSRFFVVFDELYHVSIDFPVSVDRITNRVLHCTE